MTALISATTLLARLRRVGSAILSFRWRVEHVETPLRRLADGAEAPRLSTLIRYVEALGGLLVVQARFPDGDQVIAYQRSRRGTQGT